MNQSETPAHSRPPEGSWLRYQTWRMRSIWRSIRAAPSPLRRFWALTLKRSGLSQHFTWKHNGYRLRLYPSAHTINHYSNPHNHDEDERLLEQLLKPGDFVVDVGANVGILTLAALQSISPGGKVVALEAHPVTFAYLQGNLALNRVGSSQVTALNLAAAAESGTIRFTDSGLDALNHVSLDGVGIDVPSVRLDDLLADMLGDHGEIALLKVDVEGYEYEVFSGAQAILAHTRFVYFEYGQEWYARFGKSLIAVLDLLRPHGFDIYRMEGGDPVLLVAHDASDVTQESLDVALSSGSETTESVNLLASRAGDLPPHRDMQG